MTSWISSVSITAPYLFSAQGISTFSLPTYLIVPETVVSLLATLVQFSLVTYLVVSLFIFISNQTFVAQAFTFSEKELNSLEDLIIGLSIICLFFMVNVFGLFCFFGDLAFNPTVITLYVISVILFLTPITLLFHFGFYFIINLKGAAANLSLLYELVLDYINVLSFFLRLNVQLVRIVIIGVIYVMYNEVILSYSYTYAPTLSYNHGTGMVGSLLVGFYLRVTLELIHTAIIFLAQFGAFLIMVVWLFQYLFTVFFGDVMEDHFHTLRNIRR